MSPGWGQVHSLSLGGEQEGCKGTGGYLSIKVFLRLRNVFFHVVASANVHQDLQGVSCAAVVSMHCQEKTFWEVQRCGFGGEGATLSAEASVPLT